MYVLIWHSQYGKEAIEECDSLEEAHTLQAEYQMALTLHEMLMHEIGEEETKNVTLAKEMLENIGVKV